MKGKQRIIVLDDGETWDDLNSNALVAAVTKAQMAQLHEGIKAKDVEPGIKGTRVSWLFEQQLRRDEKTMARVAARKKGKE
jgi:AmiR/NasT family two-component response regulator